MDHQATYEYAAGCRWRSGWPLGAVTVVSGRGRRGVADGLRCAVAAPYPVPGAGRRRSARWATSRPAWNWPPSWPHWTSQPGRAVAGHQVLPGTPTGLVAGVAMTGAGLQVSQGHSQPPAGGSRAVPGLSRTGGPLAGTSPVFPRAGRAHARVRPGSTSLRRGARAAARLVAETSPRPGPGPGYLFRGDRRPDHQVPRQASCAALRCSWSFGHRRPCSSASNPSYMRRRGGNAVPPAGYLDAAARVARGPAPELRRGRRALQIDDAPLLHQGLTLADLGPPGRADRVRHAHP